MVNLRIKELFWASENRKEQFAILRIGFEDDNTTLQQGSKKLLSTRFKKMHPARNTKGLNNHGLLIHIALDPEASNKITTPPNKFRN
jgi:hypothetical protein